MEVEQPQRSALADALTRSEQRWNGKEPEATAPESIEPESPETPAPEATETIPSSPVEPEPEAPRFNYKNQEEAERAVEETKRRMHEATGEAARLREELDRAQRDREAIPPTPTPAPTTTAAPGETLEETMRKMFDLQQELEIDGNKEAYVSGMAELWRNGFGNDPRLREIFQEEARKVAREHFDQEWTTRQTRVKVEQDQRTQQERDYALVLERTKSAGIDLESDERAKNIFWKVASVEADTLLPGGELEAVVGEAIKIFHTYLPPSVTTPEPTPEPEPVQPPEPPRRPPQPMGRQSGSPVGVPTGDTENSDRRGITLEEVAQKIRNASRLRP